MDKCWFLLVKGERFGPFTLAEVRRHPLLKPKILVWKKGYKDWVEARKVPELKDLFEKEQEEVSDESNKLKVIPPEVLAVQAPSPNFFMWALIALVMLVYVFYQIYFNK